MRALPWILVLVACGDPNNGTAVGNPGKLSMEVTDLPPGSTLNTGSFDVAALEVAGGGRVNIVKFDDPFDLVEPADVEFPPGEWDTAVILPRGDTPLVLAGELEDGTPFEVSLPVEPMVFEGAFTVDGDDVIVGLTLRRNSRVDGAQETPPENDSGAPDLAGSDVGGEFGVGEGLFFDENGDGRAEAEELKLDAVERERACATGGGLATLLWLPLLLVSRRR